MHEVRPTYPTGATVMWPTERDSRFLLDYVSGMFARLRDELGLPRELGAHCLRHSYVTHLKLAGVASGASFTGVREARGIRVWDALGVA